MLHKSPAASLLSPALAMAALALLATPAMAQSIGCDGRNILDEIKAKDAAAVARIDSAAANAKNGKTLLWKIENEEFPDRPASYLFGTLHVTDERLYALSPAVQEALNVSSRIAMEVDETSLERTQEALSVMRTAQQPAGAAKLETLLGKPEAQRASVVLAKAGLTTEMQTNARPWVATLLSSVSECEQRRQKQGKATLDQQIARQAENRGVGSFGLESTEMQYGALADVPDAEQVSLLKATLAVQDRLDDVTEAMVQLYLAHEIGKLWPLQREVGLRFGASAKALDAYAQNAIEERNVRMRDRTLMHLNSGGVFIAVGAMHLPGEKGLVELMKEAGFKLTAIE